MEVVHAKVDYECGDSFGGCQLFKKAFNAAGQVDALNRVDPFFDGVGTVFSKVGGAFVGRADEIAEAMLNVFEHLKCTMFWWRRRGRQQKLRDDAEGAANADRSGDGDGGIFAHEGFDFSSGVVGKLSGLFKFRDVVSHEED